MKTILEKLDALKDPQALVRGGGRRGDEERRKKRRGKTREIGPRSCLMCWDEIYSNDLPGSFEIHKVINSCSAFSGGKNNSGAARRLYRSKEKKKKKLGPNWIGSAIVSAQIVTVGKAAQKVARHR